MPASRTGSPAQDGAEEILAGQGEQHRLAKGKHPIEFVQDGDGLVGRCGEVGTGIDNQGFSRQAAGERRVGLGSEKIDDLNHNVVVQLRIL